MDPSYGDNPGDGYFDDGLIQEQDLPYDEEDDEKIDETFGDDLPVGKRLVLQLRADQRNLFTVFNKIS